MTKESPLIVYWGPRSAANTYVGEWNMLYEEPTNLFSDLTSQKNLNTKGNSFFSCPASSNRLKKTFVFRNNLHASFSYNGEDPNNVQVTSNTVANVGLSSKRQSALIKGASLVYEMQYTFFAEEPVLAMMSSPMFHKAGYLKYGALVPGEYDISKWFRPLNLEFQMWDSSGVFILEEGEPLFYLEVKTDRPVELKRFEFSPKLVEYSDSCRNSPVSYGSHLSLNKRYHRFVSTRTNELVLKEIKNNLL